MELGTLNACIMGFLGQKDSTERNSFYWYEEAARLFVSLVNPNRLQYSYLFVFFFLGYPNGRQNLKNFTKSLDSVFGNWCTVFANLVKYN